MTPEQIEAWLALEGWELIQVKGYKPQYRKGNTHYSGGCDDPVIGTKYAAVLVDNPNRLPTKQLLLVYNRINGDLI